MATEPRIVPGLGLTTFHELGSSGWKDDMDANLLLLSIVGRGYAGSFESAEPPTPSSGDIIILTAATAEGAKYDVAAYDEDHWAYFTPQEGWIFWVASESKFFMFDGSEWTEVETGGGGGGGGIGGTPYDFGFTFSTTPSEFDVLGRVRIGRDITIPADMAGSSGGVATNPDDEWAIDVQDDGVSIGTITVSDAGAVTFATADNQPQQVAAGSEITFVAGNVASVADGSFVILATVDQE